MKAPLDELYFTWLYSQVADTTIKTPSRTYWGMCRQLYTKEFVWFVPNDDNRIEDGKDLRYEFVDDQKLNDVDESWLHLGCSMLELLVGLSRRLAFEAEGQPRDWFWRLIRNIGLQNFSDSNPFHMTQEEVDEILNRVIWRTYEKTGHGGLFPLMNQHKDQRQVELWYQLSSYVLELR
jgi:hypothetical protein